MCSYGEPHPCSYYQILGISRDEQDAYVIEEAALACAIRVRVYQLAREEEVILRLNEIARALITLLDPAQRRQYDHRLDVLTGRALPSPPSVGELDGPVSGEATLRFHTNDGGACDVKLVYQKKATPSRSKAHGEAIQAKLAGV
jgi:hypothetical protein